MERGRGHFLLSVVKGSSTKRRCSELAKEMLEILKTRFEENRQRHQGLEWGDIQARLDKNHAKLQSLQNMENTGGEPDVIGQDPLTGEYIFCDCSADTPAGRRSICFDRKGQDAREKKGVYPQGNAVEMAEEMGIELLTVDQYRKLQELGSFDQKTSSWLQTPPDIRKLGGALFGDRRYGHVFIYHNGAQVVLRCTRISGTVARVTSTVQQSIHPFSGRADSESYTDDQLCFDYKIKPGQRQPMQST